MCRSTVRGDRSILSAIDLAEFPSARRAMTSRSRGVRETRSFNISICAKGYDPVADAGRQAKPDLDYLGRKYRPARRQRR
jgi:hypothetical protein